jgi:hypothetical protein
MFTKHGVIVRKVFPLGLDSPYSFNKDKFTKEMLVACIFLMLKISYTYYIRYDDGDDQHDVKNDEHDDDDDNCDTTI